MRGLMLAMVMGVGVAAAQPVSPQTIAAVQRVCTVERYAKETGDGVDADTVAIQKAIDDCASKGGGVVRLSEAQKFVSGPLVLKSHITLEIAAGTTLEASTKHEDYPEIELFGEKAKQGLLSAKGAEDITIRGGGIIDGRGESWWPNRAEGYLRPRMIVFDHCRHVLMENVTVENSPMWQITSYYSEDVMFRNMKVLAPEPEGHNTDGIDPFSSKHVVIDHVTIDTGDDNVAIKSGQPGSAGPDDPSVDVTITDCVFLHGHGLSVGSELSGGVQHVRAERVTFKGTTQGIRIKSGRDRGGDIGDFVYKDITMEDVATPIQITEYYGGSKQGAAAVTPAAVTRLTPHIHDVTIENLKATGAKTAMDIEGLPEAPLVGVRLKNVRIEAAKPAKIYYAEVVSQGLVIGAGSGKPVMVGAGVTGSLK